MAEADPSPLPHFSNVDSVAPDYSLPAVWIYLSLGYEFKKQKISRLSLCNPGLPGTLYVDQAALKRSETCLPLSPEY